MNIISIQSHVVYGHVGNSAAVFPLQRMGHEVWPIHTVQFSNHTGYGDWTGKVFDADLIGQCMAGLRARGVLPACDGLLSGYVGSVAAGAQVLEAAQALKQENPAALYCCDPVIGDTGRGVYTQAGVADFMRERALPAANIITPNQFELEYLAGFAISTADDLLRALARLHARGPSIILVTSLLAAGTLPGRIGVAVSDGKLVWTIQTPRLPVAANGAGDCIAALFFAHYLTTRSAPEAMSQAVSSVHGLLQRTLICGSQEMALVEAQDEFVRPARVFPPYVLEI